MTGSPNELMQERDSARQPAGLSGWSRVQDPVPWVAGLFSATVLLQRIAVPGLPISVTVPLAVAWIVIMCALGVGELNRTRLLVWLFAAGISGLLMAGQVLLVARPHISFNSWALWVVTWLPVVVQLRDRDRQTYLRFVRAIAGIGVGLAALSLSFIGLQLVGVPPHDWLAFVLPPNLLVDGYNTSYPVAYGSAIYKSNGWISLEPSFMSFFLGVAFACALLGRVGLPSVLLVLAGLLSTMAGSGLAVVAVFLAVLLVQGQAYMVRRYALPVTVAVAIFATTTFGQALFSRVTEFGSGNSSTALRVIEPYPELWPYWIADPAGIFLGHGAGASADIVESLGVDGLLVPNIAKVLFDYGLIGGISLLALMVVTFLRSPSLALAIALAASMFLLQGAAQPLAICCIMLTAFWSPAQAVITHRPQLRTSRRDQPRIRTFAR
jgi:hypothetical protein